MLFCNLREMATLSCHPLLYFPDSYSEQGTGLHPLQSPTTSFCLTLRVGLNTSPRFCLGALEKGAAGGQASHLTSLSCFGHGQIHVLEASFLPHLPLTFWTHTAAVVADESLAKDLHTHTSSFQMQIQELMSTHLSQQPQHKVLQLRLSACAFQVSSAHLMEYTKFLPLFSLCYFLLFPSHRAMAAKLGSGLPCARDMMKERILTFMKSQGCCPRLY